MAKKYLVKVYDTNGDFLTTWNDVVSDIRYSNEINTAGGELRLTLARNAGDYGEGSDVDFGHKVKVYVIDKEAPDGLIVFQGYISAYTPIYKDNNVEITVLSYGAELTDYILEAGEAYVTSQSSNTYQRAFGNYGVGNYLTAKVAQTFTASATYKLSRVQIVARTEQGYDNSIGGTGFYDRTNVPCIAYVYTGGTPESGTYLGASEIFYIPDKTLREISIIFNPTIQITSGNPYSIVIDPFYYSYNQYVASIAEGSGFANGSAWHTQNALA